MSFIDDVVSVGKSAVGFLSGEGIGASLARTALLGYTLNRISRSNQPSVTTDLASSKEIDRTARLQVNPNVDNKLPIVYGQAQLGGIIIDVQLSTDNKQLYFVTAISEITGTKKSDNQPSSYNIKNIYINGNRVVFDSTGQVVKYTVDSDSNIDYSYADLISIECYSTSSTCIVPDGYSYDVSSKRAYNLMPGWDSTYAMADTLFAIVKITYNQDKNLTSIPEVKFHVQNSMTLPSDCVYDYMTNTRYGCGIDPTEVYYQ